MNKKVALVTLIESSLIFSDEDKLALIERVPSFTDRQVDLLGRYLAMERQFVLEHKDDLRKNLDALLVEMEHKDDAVYVGTGRPG